MLVCLCVPVSYHPLPQQKINCRKVFSCGYGAFKPYGLKHNQQTSQLLMNMAYIAHLVHYIVRHQMLYIQCPKLKKPIILLAHVRKESRPCAYVTHTISTYVAHAESAILTLSALSTHLLAQFLPPRAARQQNSQQVNFYCLIFNNLWRFS